MLNRPQAVDLVSWLFWVLVAGGLAVSVFAVTRRHQLADGWPALHPTDSHVRPVSWLPVVVTLYVVIAFTVLILVAMFRQGQAWTRYALTVSAVGIVAGGFAVMRTSPPTSVRWALVVAAGLAAAVVVLLWHPAASGYLHGVDHDSEE